MRFTDEPESSDTGPTGYSQRYASELLISSTFHAQHSKDDALTTNPLSTPQSALELAQKAAKLASNTREGCQEVIGGDGVQEGLECLKDQRDEAIAQRDAALESCRALRLELQKLKKSTKEKGEKTDQVLRLVTASLQSLQKSSESVDG
jgi:hypothetical protein